MKLAGFFIWLALGADLEDGAVRSHLKECLKTILDNNVAQVRLCKPVIHITSRRENKLENCPCTTYAYDKESS